MQVESKEKIKTLEDYKEMLLDAGYILYIPADKTRRDEWFYYSDGEAFVYVQTEKLMIVKPAIFYNFSCDTRSHHFVYGKPKELTLAHFDVFIENTKKYDSAIMCENKFMRLISKWDYIRCEKLTLPSNKGKGK